MKQSAEILILILADLGTDNRCHRLASSLKRLGYDPLVLCDSPLVPPGPAWDGLRVRALTSRSHHRGFLRAFVPFTLRLARVLLTTGSPVWIAADGPPLLTAALIGRLRRRRVIYDAREILEETPMIRGRLSRRLAWIPWLRLGEALASALLTVSPLFLRHYRARHPRKPMALLPNVPLTASEVPAEKPPLGPRIRLIYQGGLRAGSGLRQVLAALALAPEYDLSIYGFGPEEAALRESIMGLGLQDRVFLLGAVPFEELRRPIAQAHVGLHLLEPAGLSFDRTLSNKIFDYVHGLTPVLLGPTAAHRDLVKDDPVGVCVAPGLSPEDVLRGLAEIRAGYAGFREACRSAREKWAWEAFEPDLKAILKVPARGG